MLPTETEDLQKVAAAAIKETGHFAARRMDWRDLSSTRSGWSVRLRAGDEAAHPRGILPTFAGPLVCGR